MSDHDLDLIADLINGRLSPDERRAALTRLADDPELRSEYDAQLAVASLLRGAPSPTMTPDERSMLHASLREQLHLEDSPGVVATAPSRPRSRWSPATLLAAAAAVAAVVVVGAVVILPKTPSNDSMDMAAAATTTTTAATETTASDSAAPAPSDEYEEAGATITEAAASDEASRATSQPELTTTTAAEAIKDAEAFLPHLVDIELQQLESTFATDPAGFREQIDRFASEPLPVDTAAVLGCFDASDNPPDDATVSIVATATVSGVEAAVLRVDPSVGKSYLVALDTDGCLVISTTEAP